MATMTTAKSLQSELDRVAGPGRAIHPREEGGVGVGYLDPATGFGEYHGWWADAESVLAVLRGLPDWDRETVDWDQLRIPAFDD